MSRIKEDDFWIKRNLKVDDALEHFLNSMGSRAKGKRSESSKRVVYRTRRTRFGAPSVNRRSFSDEELQRFERENDGFPMAANQDEIKDFDDDVFTGICRMNTEDSTVEVKEKSRSRSLEVAALSISKLLKLRHGNSPSKPKFFDRLITGAGFSKKSCTDSDHRHEHPLLDHQEGSSGSITQLSEDEAELTSSVKEDHDGTSHYLQLLNHSKDHEDTGHNSVLAAAESDPRKGICEGVEHIRDACSPPSSPVLSGLVRQRCEKFQKFCKTDDALNSNSQQKARVKSTPTSPRLRRRCFSPVSEQTDRLVKSFYSFSRDQQFSKAVMEKGYVRALAEQINSGALPPITDDDDNKSDGNKHLTTIENGTVGSESGCKVHNVCDSVDKEVDSGDVDSLSEQRSLKGESSSTECYQHDPSSEILQYDSDSSFQKGQHNGCQKEVSDGVEKRVWSPNVKRKDTGGNQSPRSPESPKNKHRQGRSFKTDEHKGLSQEFSKPPLKPKPSLAKPNDNLVSSCSHSDVIVSGVSSPEKTSSSTPYTKDESTQSHASSCSLPSQTQSGASSICSNNTDTSNAYDNVFFGNSQLSPQELFDMSWSDTDSEFSDGSEGEDKELTSTTVVQVEQAQESTIPRDKLYKIADELLKTERAYVQRLCLLHQVFYFRIDHENRQLGFLPSEVLNQMFSSIQSIHQFHHDFLLRELESRMANWDSEKRIGDLMKKNAPFLKLYTAYVKNFDNAMNLINHWLDKSPKFAAIICEIQKLPECGNLSLQHHMLEPIQRVPRYELLLKDYLNHLPADSPDRQDAQDALDLVTKAACHSNEAMKKIEKFHKLLDIYQKLRGVGMDFISPTRDFVKEGQITKISARSSEKQSRYLFLFNDLLLICTGPLVGTYRVRAELDVDGMEVKRGDNFNILGTFIVHSKQKAIELLDENSSGDGLGWYELLRQVIQDYRNRKRSLRNESECHEVAAAKEQIGKQAPRWIPDDAATMCMTCQQTFTPFRRRHHCRACGMLICKGCSKKAPLAYMNNKLERVCIQCYDIIVNAGRGLGKPAAIEKASKKGILQVKASDSGLMSGYLQISEDNGKTWCRRWFTVHENFVMYFFRARQDVSAYHSQPLPGFTAEVLATYEKPHVFRLHHKNKKVFLFQADNDKLVKKWVHLLERLVLAQLPDDSQRLSSQSNSSSASSGSDAGNNNNSDKLSQSDSGYPADSSCGDSVTDATCDNGEESEESSAIEKL